MFLKVFVALGALAAVACASSQKRHAELVQDRALKLKPLSSWSPTLCKLNVSFSQPAAARYRELYPKEKVPESLGYTWKAREVACELHGEKRSPLRESHESFMETALCTLLQTHWVNSPFDELKIGPEAIVASGERVQIRFSEDPALGIFLERDVFAVETHTKSRGWIRADYAEKDGAWVPVKLQQFSEGSVLAVEDLEYELPAIPGGRPLLKSFWVAVGTERPLKHSLVSVRECRPY